MNAFQYVCAITISVLQIVVLKRNNCFDADFFFRCIAYKFIPTDDSLIHSCYFFPVSDVQIKLYFTLFHVALWPWSQIFVNERFIYNNKTNVRMENASGFLIRLVQSSFRMSICTTTVIRSVRNHTKSKKKSLLLQKIVSVIPFFLSSIQIYPA